MPLSNLVLIKSSQGAQVAHKGAAKVPSSIYSQIAGAVVFGDPFNGQPFPGTINKNVKTFCRAGDFICLGIPLPIGAHLEYGADAAAAAQWVANLL
jgi:cutinase